jgi:hypothetical protein
LQAAVPGNIETHLNNEEREYDQERIDQEIEENAGEVTWHRLIPPRPLGISATHERIFE